MHWASLLDLQIKLANARYAGFMKYFVICLDRCLFKNVIRGAGENDWPLSQLGPVEEVDLRDRIAAQRL